MSTLSVTDRARLFRVSLVVLNGLCASVLFFVYQYFQQTASLAAYTNYLWRYVIVWQLFGVSWPFLLSAYIAWRFMDHSYVRFLLLAVAALSATGVALVYVANTEPRSIGRMGLILRGIVLTIGLIGVESWCLEGSEPYMEFKQRVG